MYACVFLPLYGYLCAVSECYAFVFGNILLYCLTEGSYKITKNNHLLFLNIFKSIYRTHRIKQDEDHHK